MGITVVDPANRFATVRRVGGRSPRAARATDTPTTATATSTIHRPLPRRLIIIGTEGDPLEVHGLVAAGQRVVLRPTRLAPLVRGVTPHRQKDRDEKGDEDDGGEELSRSCWTPYALRTARICALRAAHLPDASNAQRVTRRPRAVRSASSHVLPSVRASPTSSHARQLLHRREHLRHVDQRDEEEPVRDRERHERDVLLLHRDRVQGGGEVEHRQEQPPVQDH